MYLLLYKRYIHIPIRSIADESLYAVREVVSSNPVTVTFYLYIYLTIL